ncbi:ABC transporter ATP-binding protein [Enterococcus lemanii]|uniref:ABC transporter ATP-binding protein n=1 Tax=Enterococcus lemanii TaxID=1159752 RepID=A0ABV9MRV3_9ENTE|nr:ABC transporter ATP-binding protein [Enterococcus lemanii]MBM7709089.1 iron(III) transport system ATP-binding protein [Enterococcus lemanii]
MLELQNIVKAYDQQTILNGVDLKVAQGEIVSILGASGSGKSTLLKVILGLETPDAGKLFYEGQDLTQCPMEKRPFNIVFQDYALFPNLTAYENLTYGLKKKRQLTTEEELQEFIDLLGLKPHLQQPIHRLSGGQKQRVALGRTLVMKPKVLLLDEPLSALDGVIKESIKTRIQMIAKTLQLTILIVTHDPEEAMTLSDKILVLNQGEIAQFGTPQQIIQQSASPFVEEFIVKQLETKRHNIEAIFQPKRPQLAVI